MDILKAIKILKSRNQTFVNNNGVSNYSKQSDEIIKALINQYKLVQNLESDNKNLNFKVSELHKEIDKYKTFLSLFGFPVDEISETIPEVFKLIESQNIASIYGCMSITIFLLHKEHIYSAIRRFIEPIRMYYTSMSFDKYKQELKADFPQQLEYFKAIDNDPSDYDNIIYSAYKEALSRLMYIEPDSKNLQNIKIDISLERYREILDSIGHLRKLN
jgi:hypothetical protein